MMSLSQIDMFASQPELSEKPKEPVPVSSSCPPKNYSKWLLLFEWDEEKQAPFQVFSTTHFGSDIKEIWIKSILSAKAREKKLQLDGKTMSLFGKFDPSKSSQFCIVFILQLTVGRVFFVFFCKTNSRQKKLTKNIRIYTFFCETLFSTKKKRKKTISLSLYTAMNLTHRNVVKEALNSQFLTLIQSVNLTILDAYKKLIEQYGYGLVTPVSKRLQF